jgi:uncharacterized OsmC-like protein
MTTSYLNDVDFPAVGALVEAVQADPDKGQTTWTSEVTWEGGFRTTARSRDLAPIAFDEPPGLGGTNTAPNPVEQLLGALGSCLVIGYAANATVAGIELKDLRIELHGDLDLQTFLGLGEGNAGFSSIGATVRIEADAESEAIEALHRKVIATSPVGHCLSRSVPIEISLA